MKSNIFIKFPQFFSFSSNPRVWRLYYEYFQEPVNIHEYRFQDVVPCTEAEIQSQTHYIGTSHSPLHSLYSVYVQEHEWVVQLVNIHEYRFQNVVPCTEAEIHSQTHYTGTSHSLPSQPLFCVCSGAWVGGAASEPPWVQVPGLGALHRGRDTLSDTRHFTLPPSQPFILCMFRSMSRWCSRWTSMSTGSRTLWPAPGWRNTLRHTTQALHTAPLHSLYSVYV